MKLVVYTDGASRGNPGPSSYGFTIQNKTGHYLYREGKFIGQATNNVAEYTAVWEALKHIKHKFPNHNLQIQLFADSKLVAEQLSGRYKIKSPQLKPIIEQIQILGLELGGVTYSHIPRSKNTMADKLANQALDLR